jgi:PAS domain S-box-containing protein
MMNGDDDDRLLALRKRAEAALQSVDLREQTEALASLPPSELRSLVHDVWVYRVELEMQNDELRRAQTALAASRDHYVELFDHAPVGYFVLDEAGVVLDCNATGAELLHREWSALVGAPLARSVAAEDRDRFHVYHRQLVQGRGVSAATVKLARADGSAFHVRIVGSPAPGAPGTWRMTVADVEEARLAEDLFTTFFDGAAIGKAMLSPEGRFLRVNPALCAMLGYSADELGAMSFADITHPDDLPESQAAMRSLVSGERRKQALEKRYVARDGRTISVEVTSALQRDAAGKPLRVLAHMLDITERKVLQASAAQNDRLATMGQLSAGVAHEINNPLSFMLFHMEGVAEDLPRLAAGLQRCHAALVAQLGVEGLARVLGPDHAAFGPAMLDDAAGRLREAVGGAQRIKEIARNLGRFGRTDHVELGPVDVGASMKDALVIASNEIRFRARVVEDFALTPPVLATRGQLGQVFLNLLINAAHATVEGRVEQNQIGLRTWVEGDRVCAEVSDTGRGIAPEHQRKVFEPFFTTKPVGVGSGLGLSICKNIIGGLGGEISFTSKLGEGTRFVIKLPRLREGEAKAVVEAPIPPAEAPSAVRGRVLIIDDEPGIRGALTRLLGRDHEVVSAASGKEARSLLEGDQGFDLVLCDLMMSEMSGMDLHAWLATVNADLADRVVFVTGGAFTTGASAYLSRVPNLRVDKPFEPAALRKLASELIRAHRASAARPPG